MEEFRNFCESMKDAPIVVEAINVLKFKNHTDTTFDGVDCLEKMAADIELLNDAE